MSLYREYLDTGNKSEAASSTPGEITAAPVKYSFKRPGESDGSDKKIDAAFHFTPPIKRPQLQGQTAKKDKKSTRPTIAAAAATAAAAASSSPDKQQSANANANAPLGFEHSKLDAWKQAQNFSMFEQVQQEHYESRASQKKWSKKKKGGNRDEEKRPIDWNAPYNPAEPTNLAEYKFSNDKMIAKYQWKDQLHAHKVDKRKRSSSASQGPVVAQMNQSNTFAAAEARPGSAHSHSNTYAPSGTPPNSTGLPTSAPAFATVAATVATTAAAPISAALAAPAAPAAAAAAATTTTPAAATTTTPAAATTTTPAAAAATAHFSSNAPERLDPVPSTTDHSMAEEDDDYEPPPAEATLPPADLDAADDESARAARAAQEEATAKRIALIAKLKAKAPSATGPSTPLVPTTPQPQQPPPPAFQAPTPHPVQAAIPPMPPSFLPPGAAALPPPPGLGWFPPPPPPSHLVPPVPFVAAPSTPDSAPASVGLSAMPTSQAQYTAPGVISAPAVRYVQPERERSFTPEADQNHGGLGLGASNPPMPNEADEPPSPPARKLTMGERYLRKQGWKRGQGLGANEDGIITSIRMEQNKRKKKSDAQGGGWDGPATGRFVGGKKRKIQGQDPDDESKKFSIIARFDGMLDGLDLDHEIQDNNLMQRIGDKMSEHGHVERLHIDRSTKGNESVFVKFTSQVSAFCAIQKTQDQDFLGNGRIVKAGFYNEDKFNDGVFT